MTTLTAASYNILADAYLRPEWFAAVDPAHLDTAWRRPAICRRIAGLDADIIGLQEVEPLVFAMLESELAPLGYVGHVAQKGQDRPDGSALFVRPTVEVQQVSTLHFDDGLQGDRASGHIALILQGRWQGRAIVIATTHLRFGPSHQRRNDHIGFRQMEQLLEATGDSGAARILGGDLNVTDTSDVIRGLHRRGFVDAYRESRGAATCNAKQRAQRIDFLLHTPELSSTPIAIPSIDDHTALPNADEPSDHLPIAARFRWSKPGSDTAL